MTSGSPIPIRLVTILTGMAQRARSSPLFRRIYRATHANQLFHHVRGLALVVLAMLSSTEELGPNESPPA